MIVSIGMMMAVQMTTTGAPPPAAPVSRTPAASKLICVETQQLGTRLSGQRVCRTKQEWDQDRRDARADTENAQRTNIH